MPASSSPSARGLRLGVPTVDFCERAKARRANGDCGFARYTGFWRRLSCRSLDEGGPTTKYVYILESLAVAEHFYTGITEDLDARLLKHNSGAVSHTSKFRPWRIKTYIAFADEARAIAFEKYLKSGSGRAFAKNAALG